MDSIGPWMRACALIVTVVCVCLCVVAQVQGVLLLLSTHLCGVVLYGVSQLVYVIVANRALARLATHRKLWLSSATAYKMSKRVTVEVCWPFT